MRLSELTRSLRSFMGIQRKRPIRTIVQSLPAVGPLIGRILGDFGEDSAIIDCFQKGDLLLFHSDGIQPEFVELDPWGAGYFGVVVNVKDIVVLGGIPVAMLDILSYTNTRIMKEVLKGLRDGCRKFRVPIVGGHVHPKAPYNSLTVAIVGLTEKRRMLTSSGAEPGDKIVLAIDLKGKIWPKWVYGWDTTSMKNAEQVQSQFMVPVKIAENHLAKAGKDISNAGVLGSLGIMLEIERLGASINLNHIPKPKDIPIDHWLKVNPGFGFVYATDRSRAENCLNIFKKHDIAAAVIGEVDDTCRLKITDGRRSVTAFDFRVDYITGIRYR